MSYSFRYENSTVPEGVTLRDWRRARSAPLTNRRRWWLGFFAGGWKA